MNLPDVLRLTALLCGARNGNDAFPHGSRHDTLAEKAEHEAVST